MKNKKDIRKLQRIDSMEIKFISLAMSPKTSSRFVLKGDGGFSMFAKVEKANDEWKIAYAPVYPLNEIDMDGHFVENPKVLRDAFYGFMESVMKGTGNGNIDVSHSFQMEDGVHLAEAWIAKAGDPMFPDHENVPIIGIRFTDEQKWMALKAGKWTGVSFAGEIGVVDVEKADDKTDPDDTDNLNLSETDTNWFKRSMTSIMKALGINHTNNREEESGMDETLRKEMKEEVSKALKDGLAEITEAVKALAPKKEESVKKSEPEPNAELDALKTKIEATEKANVELKDALKALTDKLDKMDESLAITKKGKEDAAKKETLKGEEREMYDESAAPFLPQGTMVIVEEE